MKMKNNMKLAVAVLLLAANWIAYSTGKIVKFVCPENCLCDIYQDLKRVQCIQKNLITIDTNVPRHTDILDLSNNYITSLDEDVFRDVQLKSLKSLNISYNKLSQVHFYAFRGMGKLKILDLSFNALTYVHSQWFVDMSALRSMYFQHNNFFSLHSDSVSIIFASKTLQSLNLANTNMAYIAGDFFANLPALQHLNLSCNSLIQLDVKAISSLSKLQELQIDGNELSCKQELSTYCINRQIRLHGDPCARTKSNKANSKKLEKMVIAPEIETNAPSNYDNGWLLEEIEVDDLDYIFSNCSTVPETKSTSLLDFYAMAPIVYLIYAMIVGLVLGVAIGVTLSYSCSQTRHLITADLMAKRRSQLRRRFPSIRMSRHRLSSLWNSSHSSIQYTPQAPIVTYEQCNIETTPITPRKAYDTRPLF